jgi:hypothetical protein
MGAPAVGLDNDLRLHGNLQVPAGKVKVSIHCETLQKEELLLGEEGVYM